MIWPNLSLEKLIDLISNEFVYDLWVWDSELRIDYSWQSIFIIFMNTTHWKVTIWELFILGTYYVHSGGGSIPDFSSLYFVNVRWFPFVISSMKLTTLRKCSTLVGKELTTSVSTSFTNISQLRFQWSLFKYFLGRQDPEVLHGSWCSRHNLIVDLFGNP